MKIMKKEIKYSAIFLVGVIFAILVAYYGCRHGLDFKTIEEGDFKTIEEGDCYIKIQINDNPFENDFIDTIIILSIKGDYVKYRHNNGFVSSRRIRRLKEDLVKTDSCNCR